MLPRREGVLAVTGWCWGSDQQTDQTVGQVNSQPNFISVISHTIQLDFSCRDQLGSDLIIVILEMSEEDVRERINTRHDGNETIADMLMVTTMATSNWNWCQI